MANYLKYRIDFTNAQDYACTVDLYLKDYGGPVSYLTGGPRAFTLREFNTDLDFYKPLRPQQAEIEILADNVSIDEFIGDEDDTWLVIFSVDGHEYWRGWLLQDDFQENWIDTNHIITLRAHEGLGNLKDINLTYQAGQNSVWSYVVSALEETVQDTAIGTRVINSVYYDGMDDLGDGEYFGMEQAFVENATFSTGVNTFEDYNTILEKILRAWNSSLFQYKGLWHVVRFADYLLGADTLEGIRYRVLAGNQSLSVTPSVNIGVDEGIKPVMPEMLRSVVSRVKTTKIIFKYVFPDEIICNESFMRGDKTYDSSIERWYTVSCWAHWRYPLTRVNGSTTGFKRVQELDNGQIKDNYIRITQDTEASYIISEGVSVLAGNKITVSFDWKKFSASATGPGTITAGHVLLECPSGNKYTLDEDGKWYQSNSSYTTFVKDLTIEPSSQEALKDWKNLSVTSNAIPESGDIFICLVDQVDPVYDTGFKNLKLTIDTGLRVDILGDYDQYEQDIVRRNKYEEEIFMDDGDNPNWKGSLFTEAGDLTGDRWYRYPNEEAYTFKRIKALAHWQFNKRKRMKLDVNMKGMMWDDNGVTRPISLLNDFVFVDDAPTKKFVILNLQEMDFVNATWKATLIEVYDSEIDTAEELVNYPTHSYDYIFE